jgi:YD repeat-containing protein
VEARMTTTTYNPLVGKTAECDENGRITYYEYDDLGRLKLLRDQDRNVVKTFEYNYKQ